jgi:hypothetical protein
MKNRTKNVQKLAALALGVVAAFPALAQQPAPTPAAILEELKQLRDRVQELERKLQAQQPPAQPGQWGMTPEQAKELNRIGVKAEAMQDAFTDQGYKGLRITGYADPSYIYNKNQGRAGFQFLNNVADDGYHYDNSYFGAVSLDFQKETESGTRWRLTLVPNRGTDSVIGNGGIVHEATVSIPITDLQTRFLAGHVPDWSGYEYLQPTLNKLVTHNLLFDYTLPTTYTGAGLDITRGKWIYKAMLANMNASKNQAGEKGSVLTYRVDYSRGEFQGFGFAGVHGKAANFADANAAKTRLDLFEFDAYFIRGDVTWQGQLAYGKHKGAAIVPDPVTGALRDAEWTGLSTLLAYKFTPRLEGIARLDHVRNRKNGGGLLGYTGYWDPANGSLGDTRSGLGVNPTLDCVTDPTVGECNRGANRSALSLGVGWLYDLNTTFKAEVRVDRADLPVFLVVKDGTFKKTNQLFGASVLVAW